MSENESPEPEESEEKKACDVCGEEFHPAKMSEVDDKLVCVNCETAAEKAESEEKAAPPRKLTVAEAKAYWNGSLAIVAIVLSLWAIVSFGCSILFKEALDKITIGSAPLGFWMSQQGSIICFVLLLVLYMFLMNKHDDKHGFHKEKE